MRAAMAGLWCNSSACCVRFLVSGCHGLFASLLGPLGLVSKAPANSAELRMSVSRSASDTPKAFLTGDLIDDEDLELGADLPHGKLRSDQDVKHRAATKYSDHLGGLVADDALVGEAAIAVALRSSRGQVRNHASPNPFGLEVIAISVELMAFGER
jgi:hypothetical protein